MRTLTPFLSAALSVIAVLFNCEPGSEAWSQQNQAPLDIELAQAPELKTYLHISPAFTLRYPDGFQVNEKYSYGRLGTGNGIPGVALTIPQTMTEGTNLSPDTYLSVEWRSGATTCTTQDFLAGAQTPIPVTDHGVTYQSATRSGRAAGNIYEETVFMHGCMAVRYFIHSANIGNFQAGTVREFDRAALVSILDTIRQSLN